MVMHKYLRNQMVSSEALFLEVHVHFAPRYER
jgi:hypothetical protein